MTMTDPYRNFMGAKLALFVGPKLLVLLRDDRPDLLWPGYWDLPGGGREANEAPLDTALRETQEEFSLVVPPSHIRWARAYTNSIGRTVWFLAGWMPAHAEHQIKLGDEGQGWALLSPSEFLDHPKAVPQFKSRLTDVVRGVAPDPNFTTFSERPPAA